MRAQDAKLLHLSLYGTARGAAAVDVEVAGQSSVDDPNILHRLEEWARRLRVQLDEVDRWRKSQKKRGARAKRTRHETHENPCAREILIVRWGVGGMSADNSHADATRTVSPAFLIGAPDGRPRHTDLQP